MLCDYSHIFENDTKEYTQKDAEQEILDYLYEIETKLIGGNCERANQSTTRSRKELYQNRTK